MPTVINKHPPAAAPVFSEAGAKFVADACTPLVEATRRGECALHALARGHYPGTRLPARKLDGVRSVGFWDAPAHQTWHLDWHRNEGLEITFLERGQLPFSTDTARHTLSPGQLTLTRPWQRHRVGTPAGLPASRLHWLILDLGVRRPHQAWKWPDWVLMRGRELARLTELLRHCETPVMSAQEAEVADCFASIARAVERANLTRLSLHLNELLVLLLELLQRRRTKLYPELASSSRTVELFLADLPNHLEKPWTVRSMADSCALGRTRFVHLFHRLTNATPAQHLARLRVERSQKLLDNTDQSITDIALTSGFTSSQYFATTFRRLTGISPRQYRKRKAFVA